MPILPFTPTAEPESFILTEIGRSQPELPLSPIDDGSTLSNLSMGMGAFSDSSHPMLSRDSPYNSYFHNSHWTSIRGEQFAAHTERQRERRRLEESMEVNSRPLPPPARPLTQAPTTWDLLHEPDRISLRRRQSRVANSDPERRPVDRRQRQLSPTQRSYRNARGFTDSGDRSLSPSPSHERYLNGVPYPRRRSTGSEGIRDLLPNSLLPIVAVRRQVETPSSLMGIRREGGTTIYGALREAPRISASLSYATPSQIFRSEHLIVASDDESDKELRNSDSGSDLIDDSSFPPASLYEIVNRPSQAWLNARATLGAPPGWRTRPPPNPTEEIRRLRDDPPEDPHIP
jgi:hypothetical protein